MDESDFLAALLGGMIPARMDYSHAMLQSAFNDLMQVVANLEVLGDLAARAGEDTDSKTARIIARMIDFIGHSIADSDQTSLNAVITTMNQQIAHKHPELGAPPAPPDEYNHWLATA